MTNRNKKGIYIIIIYFSIILLVEIFGFYNRPKRLKESFHGILTRKSFFGPSNTTFYLLNDSIEEKRKSSSILLYEALLKGDSLIKYKNDPWIYLYRKIDDEYMFIGKFEY